MSLLGHTSVHLKLLIITVLFNENLSYNAIFPLYIDAVNWLFQPLPIYCIIGFLPIVLTFRCIYTVNTSSSLVSCKGSCFKNVRVSCISFYIYLT